MVPIYIYIYTYINIYIYTQYLQATASAAELLEIDDSMTAGPGAKLQIIQEGSGAGTSSSAAPALRRRSSRNRSSSGVHSIDQLGGVCHKHRGLFDWIALCVSTSILALVACRSLNSCLT